MKQQWRRPTEETAICNSYSDLSPFTPFYSKNTPTHGIPTGTVAARILELQNLSKKSGVHNVFSLDTPRCEQTWTGYGRREGKCFGKPASRSSRPDGSEVQHSFPVQSGFLADHMQEHEVADGVTTWDRSGRLSSLLKPRGLCEIVQDDVLNPSRTLPKNRSCRKMQRLQNQSERESLKTRSVSLLNASMPPSSPAGCMKDQRLLGQQEILRRSKRPTQQPDTDGQGQSRRSPGRGSTQTTQSMRKQSVRDLYHQYGIDRPVGLASEDDDTVHLESHRGFCHVCLYVRGSNSVCSNCAHRFCRLCDAQSPHLAMEQWLTRKSKIQSYYNLSRNGHKDSQSSLQNEQKGSTHDPRMNGPTKTIVKDHKDAEDQESTQERSRPNARKRSRDYIFDDDSELLKEHHEVSTVRYGNSKFRRGFPKSKPDVVERLPKVPDGHIRPSQKSVSNGDELAMLPMAKSVHGDRRDIHHDYCAGHHYGHHQNNSNHEQHYSDDLHSGSSTEHEFSFEKQNYCESSSCRATHSGHSPYRHSISCRKRQPQNAAQEDLGRSDETEMTEVYELESIECAYRKQVCSGCVSKQHDSSNYVEPSPQTRKRVSRDRLPPPGSQKQIETKRLDQDMYRNPSYRADLILHESSVRPQLRKLEESLNSTESTEFLVKPTPQKLTTFRRKNYDTKTTAESKGVYKPLDSTELRPRRATIANPQQSLHATIGCSSKADSINVAVRATAPHYSRQNSASQIPPFRDGNTPVDMSSEDSGDGTSSNEVVAPRATQRRTSNAKVRREPSPKFGTTTRELLVTIPSSEITVKPTSDRSTSLSRRVSSFFKIHGRGSPAPLSKRVYVDQEEQNRLKDDDNASETTGTGVEKDYRKNPDILQRRMQLRMRIKDKKSRGDNAKNSLMSQHQLFQDDVVEVVPQTLQHALQECVTEDLQQQVHDKIVKKNRTKDKKMNLKTMREDRGHDCVWKQMILEHQDRSIPTTSTTSNSTRDNCCGIVGAEVVIRMQGGEEVVLKARLDDDNHDEEMQIGK